MNYDIRGAEHGHVVCCDSLAAGRVLPVGPSARCGERAA